MTGVLASSLSDSPCSVLLTYFGLICASAFLYEEKIQALRRSEMNFNHLLILCTLIILTDINLRIR